MLSRHKRISSLVLLLGCVALPHLGADDRILVHAKLNDRPLTLAFDTGAGGLLIFREVAEQCGLAIEPPPADARPEPGKVLFSRTEPVKFELFGETTYNLRLGVIDHLAALPLDVAGLLGWSAMRNNIWFLSGSALKLGTLDKVSPEILGWTKLRELEKQEILIVELPQQHSGPSAYLGIDTGADSGVRLSPESWAKWRQAHLEQPLTLEAYFTPGLDLVIAEYAWADEIDIGGVILRNVPVTGMNPFEIAGRPAGTVAILGLAAMKRMDTVLDGKNGFAYVHPLQTSSPPSAHNRLGAVFVPADPRTSRDLVAHIAKNSPAAIAGVRNGDILLKIDQLDVTPWRTQPGILPLRRFFDQAPGTTLHLTVRREGRPLTIDVVLRDILGSKSKSPK